LLYWLPLNATWAGAARDYVARSGMSSGMQYTLLSNGDAPQTITTFDGFDFEHAKRILDQQRAVEKYFYGDFYPLTEFSQKDDTWLVYQLDLPDENEGLVVALKRPKSSFTTGAFHLRALSRDASYEVFNFDSNQITTKSGAQLAVQGLQLSLPKNPDSALIRCRRS
jgi:hypothetical protein